MTKLEAKGFRLSPFPVLLPAAAAAAWLNPETNGLLDADTRSEKLQNLEYRAPKISGSIYAYYPATMGWNPEQIVYDLL